jgi:hypothetical protein
MKINGKKSISSRTKSKATKSKLAPKSKPLKKVHQKSVDEVHLFHSSRNMPVQLCRTDKTSPTILTEPRSSFRMFK